MLPSHYDDAWPGVAEIAYDPRMPAPPGSRDKRPYKIICISMYTSDLADLEAKVAELKRRGMTRANKSWLIRQALAALDLDTIDASAERTNASGAQGRRPDAVTPVAPARAAD